MWALYFAQLPFVSPWFLRILAKKPFQKVFGVMETGQAVFDPSGFVTTTV
jgi:hypothetical protein